MEVYSKQLISSIPMLAMIYRSLVDCQRSILSIHLSYLAEETVTRKPKEDINNLAYVRLKSVMLSMKMHEHRSFSQVWNSLPKPSQY